MALSPNATNQLFIFHLAQMTGVMNRENEPSFPWMIRSVSLLPEGPAAMFDCAWPGNKRVATMSLRAVHGKFTLTSETCAMGPYTTDACNALGKRFERSNIELVKLVGRQ